MTFDACGGYQPEQGPGSNAKHSRLYKKFNGFQQSPQRHHPVVVGDVIIRPGLIRAKKYK